MTPRLKQLQDMVREAQERFGRGQLDAALECLDQVLAIDPDNAVVHANRGIALVALCRLPEALASFDRAVCLKQDYAEAYFGRAVARLLAGDFARGWVDFEWRWKRTNGPAGLKRKEFAQPLWLGETSLAGKTLLVHAEIGLGDTLQFCRYVTPLAELGATVILQVQSPLVELLADLRGVSRVISEGQALPDFDYYCPLLSLPLAFKTELKTIPAERKYLWADPVKVERWKTRMHDATGPRVGLVWRGDPNNRDDRHRSMTLGELLQYLPLHCRYYSLQKELSEFEKCLFDAHPTAFYLADELDFTETAAVCESLDLVISVDTSVAHLSAALGKSTWILLPFSPDCRWLLSRTDSPWYPSVKLYRQDGLGDWRGVLRRVAGDLKNRV
jgi:TPR repeat/Glycosyltransferase family 9 (heptosyltransferase)